MRQILVLLSAILVAVEAASRNQTYSEPFIAFTFNSHLENHTWGLHGSGVPQMLGYFFLAGDIDNDVMPDWTDKALRICLQYKDSNSSVTEWENIRWVLNWTYPLKQVNFTAQMTLPGKMDNHREFCDLPHRHASILKFNETTMLPIFKSQLNQTVDAQTATAQQRNGANGGGGNA